MVVIRSRALQLVALGVVLTACLGVAAPAAQAGTAFGSWANFGPYLGHNYRGRSIIVTSSPSLGARAFSETETYSPSENVPAGYLGCLARLYNGSGTLMLSNGWDYSGSSLAGFNNWTGWKTNHGNYYAQSKSQAWNGSGYNTKTTSRTVNQSYPE